MKRRDPLSARPAFVGATPCLRLADKLKRGQRRHEILLRKCARNASRHSIHELRISTRRQLALMTLAGAICGAQPAGIRRSLKRCLRHTRKLRDADVQLARVDELVRDCPEIDALRKHLRHVVDRRTRATEKKLKPKNRRLARHDRELAATVAAILPNPSAAQTMLGALREAWAEAREFEEAAPQGGKPLHRARLALKRLRYVSEALHGVIPGISAAWIRKIQRRQRALGEVRDLELLSRRVKKFSTQTPRGRRRLRRVRCAMAGRVSELLTAYRPGLPKPSSLPASRRKS